MVVGDRSLRVPPALRSDTGSDRPYVLWSDYTGLLRRHAVLVFVLVLLGLAAGVAGAKLAPRTWAATASVLVTPTGVGVNNPGANRAPAGVDLDTEATLAKSENVLTRVAVQIGGSPDLADRLNVSVPPNSGILRFTFSASRPADAAAGANAFARAYLEDRRSDAEAKVKATIALRKAHLATLQTQLRQQAAKAPPPGQLNAQREVLTRLVAAETRAIDELSSRPVTPGQLLDLAKPPREYIAPDLGVWATSGLSAGLLAAIGAAVLRDHLARRIRRREDLERVHRLPVLATLPGNALKSDRLGAGSFGHAAAELAAALPPGERLVVVAGASAGAPSGATAASLGAALAHAGNEVLLVFAQATDGELATYLGAGPGGLSAVVLDATAPQRLTKPVPGVDRLRVLGPGAEVLEAAERFVDPDDPSLPSLRAGVDYVLIAAGTALTTPEAGSLAARADGTVLTVELRRSTHGQLRASLRRVGAKTVLGVVLSPRGGVTARLDRPLAERVHAG